MPNGTENDITPDAIDEALGEWRQGDCVLGEYWFAYRVDPALVLSGEAQAAASEGAELAELEVPGLVVVSQTCDIVRSCRDRHYLEVCPLIQVADTELAQIAKGQRPSYAYLPLLAAQRLVADLDRVMTVEKTVVLSWTRVPGWTSDAEGRTFAGALSRKRIRPAFPNDFVERARRLLERIKSKHSRNSDEGRAFRALREIRVQASPSWDHDQVEVMIWFIRDEEDPKFKSATWDELLEAWLGLIPSRGRFTIHGEVTTLGRMTAEEYVNSDRLDLDYLSPRA